MNLVSPTAAAMRYAEAVQTVEAQRYAKSFPSLKAPKFLVTAGKRFDKVCEESSFRDGEPGSVHAFVERATGDVYKAEGWAKPAKGVRGNVATEEGLADLMARFTSSTSYLYLA